MGRIAYLAISVAAVLVVHASAQAAMEASEEENGCILSDTKCQCSETPSSGKCIHNEGNGLCTLGLCKEGFRCDCFGYQVCDIKKCNQFTPTASASISENMPFQCQLTPQAGECRTAVDFVETAAAADNAKMDADVSVQDALTEETDSVDDVVEVLREKRRVIDIVRVVEAQEEDLDEEEVEEIEKEADVVVDAVAEAASEAQKAAEESKQAAKVKKVCKRRRNRARKLRRKEREMAGVERKEREKSRMRGKKECTECDALKKQIAAVRAERKAASRGAGEAAKEVKERKKKARNHKKRAAVVKKTAEEARARCVARATSTLKKLEAKKSERRRSGGSARGGGRRVGAA